MGGCGVRDSDGGVGGVASMHTQTYIYTHTHTHTHTTTGLRAAISAPEGGRRHGGRVGAQGRLGRHRTQVSFCSRVALWLLHSHHFSHVCWNVHAEGFELRGGGGREGVGKLNPYLRFYLKGRCCSQREPGK